jgi:predicted nucleic acid-binding protein
MNILCDTSLYIAGFIEKHPKHSQAVKLLQQRIKNNKYKWFVVPFRQASLTCNLF